MIALAVDANFPLAGATLAGLGIPTALRYGGVGSTGKRLTIAEVADLHAHGILVLGVIESTANRSDGGYNAGVADGEAALADPALASLPILFATDDQSVDTQANVDYVRGFRDVVGQVRTGAYGFGPFMASVHTAGVASWFWQAGPAPSRTGTSGFVHFWQRQGGPAVASDGPASPTTINLGGKIADLNNQLREVVLMDWSDQIPFPTTANPKGTAPVSMCIANADLYAGQAMNNTQSIIAQLATLASKVDALAAREASDHAAELTALNDQQAALLAKLLPAIQNKGTTAVDVQQLATDLAPLLPVGATPTEIGAAFTAAAAAIQGGTS